MRSVRPATCGAWARCSTSRPPFLGATVLRVLDAVVRETPPRPDALRPELPGALADVVLRCLAKAPEHRYPGAVALAEDLEAFVAGRAISAAPAPVAPEQRRLQVENSPTRCPYCHDGVSALHEDGTVVCGKCLSRHHAACWVGACASCGSADRLVRDPVVLLAGLGRRFASASSKLALGPLSFLLWLLTLLAVPAALAAVFALPEGILAHGVAQLWDWHELWIGHTLWRNHIPCPTSGWAGALLVLVLPALLGASSVAAMARAWHARDRLALAVVGLLGAALLLPVWALLTPGPAFDPDTVGQHHELLGWLLGLHSLPAFVAAARALVASGGALRSSSKGG